MKKPDIIDPGKTRKPSDTVRFMTVAVDEAGRRLDNYLMSLASGVPRSRIYRAIRSGEVRVNKGRSSASYRVKAEDIVRVPPLRMPSKTRVTAGSEARESLLSAIIEKHKAYFVLNKPSGWAVHGGSGVALGVIETLRQAMPDEPYLELVHRLDRSTSGCLLVARKRSFLREMHRQIRDDEMGKTYLMVVAGHWGHGRHRCEVPLKTQERQGGERHVIPHPHGKYCRTDFEPVDFLSGVTVVRAELHTGRTHQIRVHCAHLGHPIIGDDRYGDEDLEELTRKLKVKRLCLHAASLSFEYPQGNPVQFDAPLSKEIVRLIEKQAPKRSRSS